MKKIIIIILCFFITGLSGICAIEGGIKKQKEKEIKRNRIIDQKSNNPVPNAKVKLPSKNFTITTNKDGEFDLEAPIEKKTIMSVEKEGYKPFSLTVDKNSASKPFVIGIEKSNPFDIVIDTNMYHIGDDVFSGNSANASDFHTKSIGPFLTKNFKIGKVPKNKGCYLCIGSIIGIDTLMAKQMGQTRVNFAYATPVSVYFNGSLISEIQLNGDNQKIPIPKNLLNENSQNELTIRTGRNLFQTAYIDYDDIEIMNLSLEFE